MTFPELVLILIGHALVIICLVCIARIVIANPEREPLDPIELVARLVKLDDNNNDSKQ